VNRLIVNLEPGVRTEIIGIIHLSESFRAFAAAPRALSVYVKAG
jgi:hypothetical protein